VFGRVLAVGDVAAAPDAGDEAAFARARSSEIGCSDPAAEKRMLAAIDAAAAERDTLGGIIEIRAFGCPPGLGSHTEPRLRLDARLAAAALSIQAMKGVEIGDAFDNARLPGSAVHDELHYDDARGYWRESNRAGGIEGGMSNGEPVVVRVAMKPLPTLMRPLRSARLDTHEVADALVERSDTTAIAAAAVVGEAVVAFELARCVREKFGGDHVGDVIAAHAAYLERIPWQPR
jgi:chorismate synthase